MTKRTFPNPLLAALFLTALLTATAFAVNITYVDGQDATGNDGPKNVNNAANEAVLSCDGTDPDYKEFTPAVPTTTDADWEFVEWTPASTGNCDANDYEFVATWKKKETQPPEPEKGHTIILDANGGQFTSKTPAQDSIHLSADKTNNKLASGDLTRTDISHKTDACQEVKSWNFSANGTGITVTAAATEFGGNTTIYAIWGRKEGCYTITLNPNGGKFSTGETPTANNTLYTGTNSQIGSTNFIAASDVTHLTDACQEATSWNTSANGTGGVVTATTTFNANTTIYIVWKTKEGCSNITLNSGTGTFSDVPAPGKTKPAATTNKVISDLAVLTATLVPPTVCDEKDDTKGPWNTKADGSGDKVEASTTFGTETNDVKETTIYAIFKPIEGCIIITFNANKGSFGAGQPETKPVGTDGDGKIATASFPTVTAPSCNEPDGEKGPWNTKADGSGDKVTEATVFGTGDDKEASRIVYAIWKKKVGDCYTITFDGNQGKWGSETTIEVEVAEVPGKASFPANPQRDKHSFKEWVLENSVKIITENYEFQPTDFDAGTKNLRLYATWNTGSTPVIAPATKASSFSIVVNSQNLQILGASKAMPVSIYNLKGKLVLNSTAMPNESISVAHLPKGVYIVRAGSKTAKFAK